jgi:hypothetical protein
MVRRNDSTQETRLLPLLVATPDPAAGRRWTIGESFESANEHTNTPTPAG